MARKSTRRGNNEGSITQRKNGTWAAVITIGYNENRKPKRKFIYAKTKAEALKKMQEYTHKMITLSNYEIIENQTFGEQFKNYMLTFKQADLTTRTFENQFRNARLHIIDKIGNMSIDNVNPVVIQTILNNITKTHSYETTKKIKTLFNGFFEYAISMGLCSINPTKQTKVPKQTRDKNKEYECNVDKYKAMPKNIRQEFLDKLQNHKILKALCCIQYFSGLRIGEALALKWKDVNFKTRELDINKAETYTLEFDEEGHRVSKTNIISLTKTAASERRIPLNQTSFNILKEYFEERQSLSNQLNINLTDDNSYIFGYNDGSFRTYNSAKCMLKRFLKSQKLDNYKIHFHMLRQTFSNILFEAKVNPKIIQELLGHKDVSTTLKNYNSPTPDMLAPATHILDNMFNT